MDPSTNTSLIDKIRVLEKRIVELETRPYTNQNDPLPPSQPTDGAGSSIILHHKEANHQSPHAALDHLKEDQDLDSTHGFSLADGEDDADLMIDYASRRERLRKTFDWEMERLFLREESDMRQRDRARKALRSSIPAEGAQRASIALRESRVPIVRTEDWRSFKQLYRARDTSLCAIDILVGEPVVYDKMGLSGNWINSPERVSGVQTTNSEVGGQFPERIRIHSDLLVTILDKIINSSGSERIASDTRPVVFTRPFKALAYCKTGLERWWAEMQQASRKISASEDDPVPIQQQRGAWMEEIDESHRSDDDSTSDDSVSENDDKSRAKDIRTILRVPKAFEEIEFFRRELKTRVLQRVDYLQGDTCQKVFFSDLWHLFRPGVEVIHSGTTQAFRVLHVTSARHRMLSNLQRWAGHIHQTAEGKEQRPDFRVTCIYIDFDGKRIGPVVQKFDFDEFRGEKDILSLPIFPLRLYSLPRSRDRDSGLKDGRGGNISEAAWFKQKLIRRGAKFLNAISSQRMQYAGPIIGTDEEVEGEIIVDFEAAFTADTRADLRGERPQIASIASLLAVDDFAADSGCQFSCCEKDYVHDDTNIDKIQAAEYIKSLQPDLDAGMPPSVILLPRSLPDLKTSAGSTGALLADNELLLISNRVFGFVLRSQRWVQLTVEFLRDSQSLNPSVVPSGDGQDSGSCDDTGDSSAQSNDVSALNRLVLPSGHKAMIVSLVTQHFRTKQARRNPDVEYDVIRGKGKGLMLLLHGPPGYGKTSTAEAVATSFNKPLFQMTHGDMGTTPKELERALEINFALAARWDCIMLLDEADVFLRRRTGDDLTRNALVAVFLRILEYHAGILFLTTNRVGTFDEAFRSRIHISLYYPPFTGSQILEVVRFNLELIRQRFAQEGRRITIERDEIMKFAEDNYLRSEIGFAKLNGRQIRNATQTAIALAEFEANEEHHDTMTARDVTVILSARHFRITHTADRDFQQYLNEVRGSVEDEEIPAWRRNISSFGIREPGSARAGRNNIGNGIPHVPQGTMNATTASLGSQTQPALSDQLRVDSFQHSNEQSNRISVAQQPSIDPAHTTNSPPAGNEQSCLSADQEHHAAESGFDEAFSLLDVEHDEERRSTSAAMARRSRIPLLASSNRLQYPRSP